MADLPNRHEGESERLPPVLDIYSFAEARCQEIVALSKALDNAQKGGLIFQRLPKAMRRRMMSHHSKRMPRKLQEAHAKQLEKNGVLSTSKRPSRKFRRRPQNLLLDYNRRQKDFVWLETHIWHAKRFHMIEKWGYKIAESPTDKCYRACYRATANHCFVQDISFYCCIELSGPEEKLLEGLYVHTPSECGLTFGAKAFRGGSREGSVMIYHKGSFPFGAVGTVNFLWKAEEEATFESSKHRCLWIWAHPAIYPEVRDVLINAFDLNEVEQYLDEEETEKEQNVPHEMEKLKPHGVFNPHPKYVDKTETICMLLLKDNLNRFRLTGPLSQAVVADAFTVSALSDENGLSNNIGEGNMVLLDESEDQEIDLGNESHKHKSANRTNWWRDFYSSNGVLKSSYEEQRNFWKSMRGLYSPAILPPHQVISLTVLDPRYQLPAKRTKIVPNSVVKQTSANYSNISKKISLSPIWNEGVRKKATMSKLSNAKLAKLRSSTILVPGFSDTELNAVMNIAPSSSSAYEPSRMPVLLIQRPGSQDPTQKRLGFSSGWDVILPAGWGMPLWLALIFRGARPGGLRQSAALEFESEIGSFGNTFAPDTEAGHSEANITEQRRKDQYFRLPPNKRPNFIKLGVASPFACCWKILMRDWSQNKKKATANVPFYVLRDRIKLDALRFAVNSWARHCEKSNDANFNYSDKIEALSVLFANTNQNCLVPVKVEALKKGSPEDCSMVCIPAPEDLEMLNTNPKYNGPTEPTHDDPHSEERKALRKDHQKALKRLRRQRISRKIKLRKQMDAMLEEGKSISHLLNNVQKPDTHIIIDYAEKIKQLWVPELKTVKDTSSRTIVGFICKGDFSFSEACGVGLGYVPLQALIHLLRVWTHKPLVLIRNTHSFEYYFATLKVC